MNRFLLIGWLGITSALAVYCAAPSYAAPPTRYLMANLGDSITAASLADTRLVSRASNLTPREIEEKALYQNKDTYSWASGKRINSHFMRMKEYMTRNGLGTIDVLNAAIPGKETDNLEAQATKVVEKVRTDRSVLKYVTLLIGANDVCSSESPVGTPNDKFYAGMMKGLAKLAEIQQADPIRILMPGMPRIPDLGFPRILEQRTTLGMTCKKARDQILKFCNPMTVWSTESEYRQRRAVVEGKNDLLRQVARDANERYPNLDIHYTDAVWNWELTPSVLAIDCFHPSQDGQSLLSSVLWGEQPWFH